MGVLEELRKVLQHSMEIHLLFDFNRTGRSFNFFYANVPQAKQIFFVAPPPPDVILQHVHIPCPAHIDAFTLRRTIEIHEGFILANEERILKMLKAIKETYSDV